MRLCFRASANLGAALRTLRLRYQVYCSSTLVVCKRVLQEWRDICRREMTVSRAYQFATRHYTKLADRSYATPMPSNRLSRHPHSLARIPRSGLAADKTSGISQTLTLVGPLPTPPAFAKGEENARFAAIHTHTLLPTRTSCSRTARVCAHDGCSMSQLIDPQFDSMINV